MSIEPSVKELQKRISELELEKKHLLKLVSHDVKSPFNKLFALSNLLRLTTDNLSEEQQEYLTRMDWVIKEGLTVVRNLLDLRAIEDNQIEFYIENLNMSALISEIIHGYKKQIEAKYIVFNDITNKVTVRSDKRLLERVIDHLVSNAIKFSPKEKAIVIKSTETDSSVVFSITTESGPIPLEEEVNLYKKNSPLSARPTHGESALGNGLFIAQTYAHLLKGKIEMKQKDNCVEFVVSIPQEW